MTPRLLGGTDIVIEVPLNDDAGYPITATAVAYRVIDQDEVEKVAQTSVAGFTGDVAVTLTIPLAANTLAAGAVRELRTIELFCTTDQGQVKATFEYILEASSTLVKGVNSFQAYGASILEASSIGKIPGWESATKEQRVAALVQAAQNVDRLPIVGYPGGLLSVLTQSEFLALAITEPRFVSKLARAQILEANFLLGGDEVEEIRRSGVMSTTVGESSQFFRTVAPLEFSCCRRAIAELGGLLSFSPRTGR